MPPASVTASSRCLALGDAAAALIRPAGVALGDEALHARGLGCGQQVVGALGTQAVRQLEALLEAPEVDSAQRSELMDDRVGPGRGNCRYDRIAIERVDYDWLGTQIPQHRRLVLTACGADDRVAVIDQLRHEPLPDCACCSC
jgi:hypothetical protein